MWDFTTTDNTLDQQTWEGNIPDWSAEEPAPLHLPSPEYSALPSSLSSCSASELDGLFMTSLATVEQPQQLLPDFPNDFSGSDDPNDMLNAAFPQELPGNTATFCSTATLVAPTPSLCDSDTDTSSEWGSGEPNGSPKPTKTTSRRSSKCAGNGGAVRSAAKVSKRVPHHEVERKYRNGLNKQLEQLRNVIPSTRGVDAAGTCGKLSKTVILTSAVDYIASLEAQIELVRKGKDILYDILRIGDVRQTAPAIS